MREYNLGPGEIIGQGNDYIAYVGGAEFIRIPQNVAKSFRDTYGRDIVNASFLKVTAKIVRGDKKPKNLVGVVESNEHIELLS